MRSAAKPARNKLSEARPSVDREDSTVFGDPSGHSYRAQYRAQPASSSVAAARRALRARSSDHLAFDSHGEARGGGWIQLRWTNRVLAGGPVRGRTIRLRGLEGQALRRLVVVQYERVKPGSSEIYRYNLDAAEKIGPLRFVNHTFAFTGASRIVASPRDEAIARTTSSCRGDFGCRPSGWSPDSSSGTRRVRD